MFASELWSNIINEYNWVCIARSNLKRTEHYEVIIYSFQQPADIESRTINLKCARKKLHRMVKQDIIGIDPVACRHAGKLSKGNSIL